ncbi:MAG: hypothetical protein JW726_01365 [Anaerolineales bacterium]|nr:hypothetical protein [Anaerolineales bacterium]
MYPTDLTSSEHWTKRYQAQAASIIAGWSPQDYLSVIFEQALLSSIDQVKLDSILEIGCGSSTWLPNLVK